MFQTFQTLNKGTSIFIGNMHFQLIQGLPPHGPRKFTQERASEILIFKDEGLHFSFTQTQQKEKRFPRRRCRASLKRWSKLENILFGFCRIRNKCVVEN